MHGICMAESPHTLSREALIEQIQAYDHDFDGIERIWGRPNEPYTLEALEAKLRKCKEQAAVAQARQEAIDKLRQQTKDHKERLQDMTTLEQLKDINADICALFKMYVQDKTSIQQNLMIQAYRAIVHGLNTQARIERQNLLSPRNIAYVTGISEGKLKDIMKAQISQ